MHRLRPAPSAEKVIAEQLKQIPRDNVRQKTEEYLAQMEHGERDFRF